VRRRKINYCREVKKKSIIAVRQSKIDYRREAKKKSIIAVRRRKNRYCREAKKKSAVAESSYGTLEHHLRGEQKRKLCLLEQLSTELSEALRDRRCGQKISL
jgi:hypothetical protein